jgi:glucose/mannose-6-phosphate isomerase
MDLDDLKKIKELDGEGMFAHIHSLPDQLVAAWKLGLSLPLPKMEGLQAIVVAGMGGSAIGADLVAAYVSAICPVPVYVHRDYVLPAWAKGPQTLVIASSHSGNTEEVLSSFENARQNGCQIVAISRGGKLAEAAKAAGVPYWKFEHDGYPRAALGFIFSMVLAILYRQGLIPDPSAEIEAAAAAMRKQELSLLPEVTVSQNPAKRLAGQLVGRWITILGSDYLAPIARRWKGQVSELAKAWGQFEFLPEADHATLAGIFNPQEVLSKTIVLFLTGASDYPRNQLRSQLTRQKLMEEGINTDVYHAQGATPLEQMWTAVHFGDYDLFYLAIAYETDPSPIDAIEDLKKAMKA